MIFVVEDKEMQMCDMIVVFLPPFFEGADLNDVVRDKTNSFLTYIYAGRY